MEILFKEVNQYKKELSGFGIYQLTCKPTKRTYIGSTTCSFSMRLKDHISKLKCNVHSNSKLQRAYNKYGVDSFSIKLIEIVTNKDLVRDLETTYIQSFFNLNQGDYYFNKWSLNICKTGFGSSGRIVYQETRDKIRNALKGKLAGDKHPLFGTKRTPTMLGKKHTKEALLRHLYTNVTRAFLPQKTLFYLNKYFSRFN